MAKEAAAAFVKRYGSDEAFRNKVNALDSPQAIRAHLDEQGFGTFTRQELDDAHKAAGASGELSDTELDAVAGGAWGMEWTADCTGYCQIVGQCESGYSCSSVW